jgi:hypothetical protein
MRGEELWLVAAQPWLVSLLIKPHWIGICAATLCVTVAVVISYNRRAWSASAGRRK